MTKSVLIKYTDFAIKELVIEQMLLMNPLLTRGDDMDGPSALIQAGKVVAKEVACATPPNNISFDSAAAALLPPPPKRIETKTITAGTVKLEMKSIDSFRQSALNGVDLKLTTPAFIHPYQLLVPHRDWLQIYNVGDLVTTTYTDPISFEMHDAQFNLTDEIIDSHSYVIFRFGLS